jgi:hypothetical protein
MAQVSRQMKCRCPDAGAIYSIRWAVASTSAIAMTFVEMALTTVSVRCVVARVRSRRNIGSSSSRRKVSHEGGLSVHCLRQFSPPPHPVVLFVRSSVMIPASYVVQLKVRPMLDVVRQAWREIAFYVPLSLGRENTPLLGRIISYHGGGGVDWANEPSKRADVLTASGDSLFPELRSRGPPSTVYGSPSSLHYLGFGK